MEPLDLSLLPPEFWYQQFLNLDGLNSGVPTRTTPTLTPTTLRNIEQTFIELQNETESHNNEAGFVPPVVQPISQQRDAHMKQWHGGMMTVVQGRDSSYTWPSEKANGQVDITNSQTNLQQEVDSDGGSEFSYQDFSETCSSPDTVAWTSQQQNSATTTNNYLMEGKVWSSNVTQPRPSVVTTASSTPVVNNTTGTTTRRNMGGRRPMKNAGISPEEEERRRIRRERNKMAAARCRKRRLDHTNALLEETAGLEHKKQALQDEIQFLQMQKEELEFVLEAHKATCRLPSASPPDVKPVIYITDLPVKKESAVTGEMCQPSPAKRMAIGSATKPSRPTSLPVPTAFAPQQLKTTVTLSDVTGIPLTTPTAGIPLNFESLMDGGTGLTPVSGPLVPSCSSQQRSSNAVDLSSPDSVPPKLVSL